MKYVLILTIIFNALFTFSQAEKEQSKNLYKLVGHIENTDDAIFAFTKSTFEEVTPQSWDSSNYYYVRLPFPVSSLKSNNNIEMVGEYLGTKTDKELREKIQKNHISEGATLLEDFFNTATYKKLREPIEKLVHVMMSCNFLTPEESKFLCELKFFYPDEYEYSAYTWEPIYRQNEFKALEGTLRKVVGLKGNKNFIKNDSFFVIIDINYQCSLSITVNTLAQFKEPAVKKFGPIVNVCIEPRHIMAINLVFLRNKEYNFCSASFTIKAQGRGRVSSIFDINTNKWCGANEMPDYDFEQMATPPHIYGEWYIASQWEGGSFEDLTPQFSDFIIKTEKPFDCD